MILAPPFIDLHVHLRDPGQTHKEDLISGCKAALRNGYAAICPMPNTFPAIDSPGLIQYQLEKTADLPIQILPVAAITKRQQGKELVDFAALKQAGAVAFSEDGRSVADPKLMFRAMQKIKEIDSFIIDHCETPELACAEICSPEDETISELAETTMVQREILLAEKTGVRLHLTHLSLPESFAMVKSAKEAGLSVSCDITPHHLCLHNRLPTPSPPALAKVNPPLRKPEYLEKIYAFVMDGTIDAIATDHAPHTMEEKCQPYPQAPPGFSGFDFAYPMLNSYLRGKIPPEKIFELMIAGPAKILRRPLPLLQKGSVANFLLIDEMAEFEPEPENIYSRGKNSPLLHQKLYGKVMKHFIGKVVYKHLLKYSAENFAG